MPYNENLLPTGTTWCIWRGYCLRFKRVSRLLTMSNILPKKSWHVLKPENVERVLKDEAAERRRQEATKQAVLTADREARLERMRWVIGVACLACTAGVQLARDARHLLQEERGCRRRC